MSELKATVSWTMPDEKILKLKETEMTYDISDEVHSYLQKSGLYDTLDDKKVEVVINEKQGENGTITRLSVLDGKTQTETKKVETPTTSTTNTTPTGTVRELTVHGVSVQKRGIKFKEEETWYTLDASINVEEFKQKCTKKKVQVTIVPSEKGNAVITSYIVSAEDNVEEKEKVEQEPTKKSYTNDVQKSIEAQASVNSANELVSHMTEILSNPEKVLTTITKIAEHNFKVIQELKNKG